MTPNLIKILRRPQFQKTGRRKQFPNWVRNFFVVFGFAICAETLVPQSACGAERIIVSLSLLEVSLEVESLEKFAQEGEVTPELDFYLQRLDEDAIAQFRSALQWHSSVSHVSLYRLFRTSMGEATLKRLGRVIRASPERNGWISIRAAIVGAADTPEGLTLTNVLRQFPTREIRLEASAIKRFVRELNALFAYRDAAVQAIAQAAETETAIAPVNLDAAIEPRQAGDYAVEKQVLPLQIRQVRHTPLGLVDSYDFNVDFYLPETEGRPLPLVVMSHGFGSEPKYFEPFARHLTSHGYAVAVPEHIGSDQNYQQAALRGELSNKVSPIEFISRPLDIRYLLDELEALAAKDSFWQRLNLEQVGIMGHSFGGYTAFALAGAPLNDPRLDTCAAMNLTLNPSVILQCRADYLPRSNQILSDPRIQAVIAVNPIDSTVFGPENMAQIEIPTMMVSGSNDLLAPAIEEQIHPFIWLGSENKYLALMVPGTHSSTSSDVINAQMPTLLSSPRPDLGRSYLKAISLAFFETHLRQRPEFEAYLSSAYAEAISEDELALHLVDSLDADQLESAYGSPPPIPVIPELEVADRSPSRNESILAEIRREGVLKVAMRRDAAPLGYLDAEGIWTGYCTDLAESLASELSEQFNRSQDIEVVRLVSTLDNRFELVKEGNAHFECGPNTIRDDIDGITFSNPFFVAGARFVVPLEQGEVLDSNGGMASPVSVGTIAESKVGVLRNTTTELFLAENYPRIQTVYFQGATGRAEALQALIKGEIESFISDDILIEGEIARQNLPRNNFMLLPEQPLTCEFYGLILPEGNREWKLTVDTFIRETALELSRKWLTEFSGEDVLTSFNRCLNQ